MGRNDALIYKIVIYNLDEINTIIYINGILTIIAILDIISIIYIITIIHITDRKGTIGTQCGTVN